MSKPDISLELDGYQGDISETVAARNTSLATPFGKDAS